MLNNDIPVIFSYDNTIFNRGEKLKLYKPQFESLPSYNGSSPKYNLIDYNEQGEPVSSHYMVITGIVEYSDDVKKSLSRSDGEKYETMLQISSWGRKYYVSLSFFTDRLSKFTNIMYLKNVKK